MREKIQTTNQNGKRDITTDPIDIKNIIRKYYKQLYVHIFDNLDEMDQFPEEYKLRILGKEEVDWTRDIEYPCLYLLIK